MKPKEEPKKEEVKKTVKKVVKAKKYEDLPEIPDYERPVLEVYEESEFDPTKLQKSVATPVKQTEQPGVQSATAETPVKNGLPKVSFLLSPFVALFVFDLSMSCTEKIRKYSDICIIYICIWFVMVVNH